MISNEKTKNSKYILNSNICETENGFVWTEKVKNLSFILNIADCNQAANGSTSRVLRGIVVVSCGLRQLLWSVHECEEEQGHIIWAPVGCMWGHCWPVAALHQTLPQLEINASFQLHCNTEEFQIYIHLNEMSQCCLLKTAKTHIWVKVTILC